MSRPLASIGTVITADTRFSPSRRPAKPRTKAEIQHIRQVGEIVHAWNHAHGALFHVFSVALADDDIGTAHAVWHSIQSDAGQRIMLESVIRERFKSPGNSIRRGTLWAIRALSALATLRNQVAHVEIIGGIDEIIPGFSARTQFALQLEDNPLAGRWRAMRGDLYAITNYLDGVYLALWNDYPRPLSRRPRLQSVRIQSEESQRRSRRAKKLARERQRRSSQA